MIQATFDAFQDELIKIASMTIDEMRSYVRDVTPAGTRSKAPDSVREMRSNLASRLRESSGKKVGAQKKPIQLSESMVKQPTLAPTGVLPAKAPAQTVNFRGASPHVPAPHVAVPHPAAIASEAGQAGRGLGKAVGGFARAHGKGLVAGAGLATAGALALHAMRKPNAASR